MISAAFSPAELDLIAANLTATRLAHGRPAPTPGEVAATTGELLNLRLLGAIAEGVLGATIGVDFDGECHFYPSASAAPQFEVAYGVAAAWPDSAIRAETLHLLGELLDNAG